MSTKTHFLHLQFDAEQLTQVLQYSITSGGKPSKRSAGRYSGSYHFEKGDAIEISVTMTSMGDASSNMEVEGYSIAGLDLICQPHTKQLQTYLSPYDKNQASCQINTWGIPKETYDRKIDMTMRTIASLQTLSIASAGGQWSLSGYLSVLIEAVIDGISVTTPRVFSFDPEVIVGTGSDPH